jgi:hypothetical protein
MMPAIVPENSKSNPSVGYLPGLSTQDSFHFSKDSFWNTQDSESLHQLLNNNFLQSSLPSLNTEPHLRPNSEQVFQQQQQQPQQVQTQPVVPQNVGSPNVSSPPSSNESTTSVTSSVPSGHSFGSSSTLSSMLAAQNFPGIGPAILPTNPAATLPPSLASIPAIQNIQTKLLNGEPLGSISASSSGSSSGSSLALSSFSGSRDLMKVDKEPSYVDVTPYLILPQHEAARRLGVPCSTLSKRWKEASLNRKWPYRIVCKLDKEITTLLKNVENSQTNQAVPLSPAVEETLALLLRKRQDELRAVVIRLQ